ncbi:TIR-NBS-LRR type disease resistance protein, putative [Medicago truncatula]|uniref:TIR-NBS-LRR type disease resistance protein, putative n=1 Tax=Medicago truncatula TaxID=3880 RepID=G7JD66_MEDTR|nr:TIR-NBS-LRR type disease resistance protein, putative [Medicago truncatula]
MNVIFNEDILLNEREIKWVDERAKELDSSRFKNWYTNKVRTRNEVDIIVNTESKKDIVYVKRIGYHIIVIQFIM